MTDDALCIIMMLMQNISDQMSHTRVCLLLDFYSQLLTDKTRSVLELYFQEDMSLSEIADELLISRQGVHDKIRQGSRLLEEYEKKLKMAEHFISQKKLIEQALDLLNQDDISGARETLADLNNLL